MARVLLLLCVLLVGVPTIHATKSKLAPALETQKMPIVEYTTRITGQLPAWLRGTFIRNVPNVYEVGNDQVRSWTDPLAAIHVFKFDGSSVRHTARNLESPAYTEAVKHNGFPYKQFYTPKNPGPRPTGGHVPYPCAMGPCIPDPYLNASGHQQEIQAAGPEMLAAEESLPWKPGSVVGVNPNVDIARYVAQDGKELFLALTDQNVFVAFSAEDGSTTAPGPCPWDKGDVPCSDFMSNDLLSAAHEKFDYNTGEHFNFLQKPQTVPKLTHPTIRLTRYKDGSESFARWAGPEHQSSNISFIHSSHITENYFIVQQPPVNMAGNLASLTQPPHNFSMFDQTQAVQWHVLDRKTGERKALISALGTEWEGDAPGLSRQTYFRGEGVSGAFFHTHTLNAFEDGDNLVMDFIGFPDNAIFYGVGLELMIDNPRDYMHTWENARLTRCTVNQTSHKVSCEVLADVNFGLPCFNIEHYQMKPYAYAYGTSIRNANTSDFIDKLIKIDIPARKVSAEWYQEGTYVTEPVFIASPNSTAEDDGLLISTVFDTSVDKSFIVVLDARDLKEVSRVNLDYKVQAHFHGKFCKSYGDLTCVGS